MHKKLASRENSKGSIRSDSAVFEALNLHSFKKNQFDLRRSHVCNRLFADGEDVCCFKYHLRHKNHDVDSVFVDRMCFASNLKFIEFVSKYNTPVPDSNPKLNVVWQNKDGRSQKVSHSQTWDLLTSR